ncbi:hypothetical protein AB3662_10400 [Sorangium cellulosum]|uniref:hypothetical protein n=1 Tax=Sorangium cellulosum TaxID=56 RepID=UPI003D9A7119
MFGPGHPQYRPQPPPHYPQQPPPHYYPPPPPPPQRPKPGVSPLVIVLAVVGGMFMLGVGALVVLGGVAYLMASATPEHAVVEAEESEPSGVKTANGASPAPPPLQTNTPLRPDLEADEAAGADPSSGDRAAGNALSPDSDDGAGEAPAAAAAPGGRRTSPGDGAAAEGSSSGSATGGTSWWCTASASVRVCGFAGACNYQMVFGNGGGKDRFMASQQAKRSCEASARAKGASAICVVQCSPR